jgi:hypothetical protein
MAGTIIADVIQSDQSYPSSINIASPMVVSNTLSMNGGSLVGNLGINTNTPNCALEVNSTSGEPIAFFKATASDASIVVAGNGESYIEFRNTSVESGNGTNSWGIGTNDNLDLHFDYGTNGTMNKSQNVSSAHKMLLTNAGNLNIRGRMTKELQPAFSAYINSSTNNDWTTSLSNTVYPFGEIVFNRGSHYNTSTYRFTAPVAGLYYFGFRFNRLTNSRFDAGIYKNGTVLHWDEHRATSPTTEWQQEFSSWLVQASANDYFDLRVVSVTATGSAFIDGGIAYDAFFGWLVA